MLERLIINKDTPIDFSKPSEPLAITEIWYGEQLKWANRYKEEVDTTDEFLSLLKIKMAKEEADGQSTDRRQGI